MAAIAVLAGLQLEIYGVASYIRVATEPPKSQYVWLWGRVRAKFFAYDPAANNVLPVFDAAWSSAAWGLSLALTPLLSSAPVW